MRRSLRNKQEQTGPVVNLNVSIGLQELLDKINSALAPQGYQIVLIKLPSSNEGGNKNVGKEKKG